MTYKIFLSHSAADAELVGGIEAQVRAIGIEPYLYEEHFNPDTYIPEKLKSAISDADALVALLTPIVRGEVTFIRRSGTQWPRQARTGLGYSRRPGCCAGHALRDREYIRVDPRDPLPGMATLLRFLTEQAEQADRDRAHSMRADAEAAERVRRAEQQQELMAALAAIALLLLLAYAVNQASSR